MKSNTVDVGFMAVKALNAHAGSNIPHKSMSIGSTGNENVSGVTTRNVDSIHIAGVPMKILDHLA